MVSNTSLFNWRASSLSKGRRIKMNASANPCTPRPMGRWRMLELRASGMG